MKTVVAKYKWINQSDKRLDASFHLSDGRLSKGIIENNSPYPVSKLAKVSTDIFYGGRAKRIYVDSKEKGVPFMGSADMMKASLSSLKFISKKHTKNLDGYYLKEGWTLVSRSGTIGNTAYTNNNFIGIAASEHIIRVVPNSDIKSGFLYAFLTSKHGYNLMTQGTFGAVIQHIEPEFLSKLPVPIFPETKQQQIHNLIVEAAKLRVKANILINDAKEALMNKTKLIDLTSDNYDYFGTHSNKRKVSTFKRNIKEINSISINAFNYSKRVESIENKIIDNNETISLFDALNSKKFFSTGSFPRVELNSDKAIRLINQSDIFNIKIEGKKISRRKVKTNNLVSYEEVLIAGVGTLGENETFCRAIFANEELEGELISGEFIRMITNDKIPSGYLFAWLSSDYGFRLIRKTQTGTKLCRPIPAMLAEIPIPVLDKETMDEIDKMIKSAHTHRYEAMNKEKEAIQLIETEIDSWQN